MDIVTANVSETLDIELSEDLLKENRRLAEKARKIMDEKNVFSIDVMGSIGSGKTAIIEELAKRLSNRLKIGMIAGDAASTIDAERVQKHGVKAVQINTGRECHLDGNLILKALNRVNLDNLDLLFIENVGNLICPVDYPLGAHKRLVVISITEGNDMVLKHPLIFREADVLAINKLDLKDVMGVNIDKLKEEAQNLNAKLKVVYTSAKTGEGVDKLVTVLKIPKK